MSKKEANLNMTEIGYHNDNSLIQGMYDNSANTNIVYLDQAHYKNAQLSKEKKI